MRTFCLYHATLHPAFDDSALSGLEQNVLKENAESISLMIDYVI